MLWRDDEDTIPISGLLFLFRNAPFSFRLFGPEDRTLSSGQDKLLSVEKNDENRSLKTGTCLMGVPRAMSS